MSRSELHNWECAIEQLSGDNADKMLAIAQDIYNTAFVHGKNYMTLVEMPEARNDVLNKIRAEIEAKIVKRPWLDFEDRERDRNDAYLEVLDIIDKYIEGSESE